VDREEIQKVICFVYLGGKCEMYEDHNDCAFAIIENNTTGEKVYFQREWTKNGAAFFKDTRMSLEEALKFF
jgi:hypothetical protein